MRSEDTEELLGAALGRCLAQLNGLSAAYLPEGVRSDCAEAVVRAANAARPATPPFAVLVTLEAGSETDPLCLKLTPPEAIRFRQGDRLAVVSGRHPDLASFVQAFREGLGPDYPAGTHLGAPLRALASEIMTIVLRGAGVDDRSPDARGVGVASLQNCMELLRDAYELTNTGTSAWNAYWFQHVSTAMSYLVDSLQEQRRSAPDSDLAALLEKAIPAAFGLPHPVVRMKGKDLVAAVDTWWSDGPSAAQSARLLRFHPDNPVAGQPHELESIGWSELTKVSAHEGYDNPLLAFQAVDPRGAHRVRAFSQLTVEQFTNPSGTLQGESIEVTLAGGQPLTPTTQINEPVLIPFEQRAEVVGKARYYRSHPLRLAIPAVGLGEHADVSSVQLSCSLAGTVWVTTSNLGVQHAGTRSYIALEGYFRRKTSPKDSIRKATIRVQSTDPVVGSALGGGGVRPITFLPAQGPAVVVMPQVRSRLGTPKFFGAENLELHGEGIEFGPETTHFLLAIAHAGDTVEFAGKPLPRWIDGLDVFAGIVAPADLDVLVIGEREVVCHGFEPDDDFQSPVLAAASQSQVSSTIDEEARYSIRGEYEQFVSQLAAAGEIDACLAHCILTEDDPSGPLGAELNETLGVWMSLPLARRWSDLSDFAVPESIRTSAEWRNFCGAFQSLGVVDLLLSQPGDTGAEWPSRTSWRHLWDDKRKDLGAYLDAYTALLEKARALEDPAAVFWATYPFSISVWRTESSAECTAVLLSPLHPVRLAWLASVESAIWESEHAPELMGLVEGWNLPLLGVNYSWASQMLAIPSDHGPGQVFLGWSMLVAASNSGTKHLRAPRRIMGRTSPGSSASGLNGAAVTEALTTYRRINPHVTTLTLDLAAQVPTSRLREVDEAVVEAAAHWGNNGATRGYATSLTGGVRIWDSLNRDGEPPGDELSRILADDRTIPLTWGRYKPDPTHPQSCNMRLIQDSAINVAVNEGPDREAEDSGVVTARPLRRYDAAIGEDPFRARPGVRAEGGWEPWRLALRAAEGLNQSTGKTVQAHVRPGLLATNEADWTVSGEALTHPAALAKMLEQSTGASQMLWEWRPPVLSGSRNSAPVERRPYISVVRVPRAFRRHVSKLIQRVGVARPEDQVDSVLRTLGSRGIGLSSLIAIGGTHAQGALGFYLTLRLLESTDFPPGEFLVIPIDACDAFLRALVGSGGAENSLKRADLLMIHLSDDELVLAPVEIKFYASTAWDRGSLQEAVNQAGATLDLLQQLRERQRTDRESATAGDIALWHMALATLVETGMKLRPDRNGDGATIARRLRSVADGESIVRIGHPLVAYFGASPDGHEAGHAATYDLESESGSARFKFGVLRADAASAFTAANEPDRLSDDWAQLVSWSLGDFKPTDDPQRPPSATVEIVVDAVGSSPARGELAALGYRGERPEQVAQETTPANPSAMPVADLLWASGVNGSGVRFDVGDLLGSVGRAAATYWPSNTALTQLNIGVVGDLGTGKTQLLKTLVHELRRTASGTQETPLSVLILDYKSDFRDRPFLESVGGTVLPPRHIPLNVFALDGRTPYERARAFTDVLTRIYGGIGPVQKQRLNTAIQACFARATGGEPTMGEVFAEYQNATNGVADSVSSILEMFVMSEVFSEERDDLRTFRDLMSDRVLVIGLSELGVDKDAKNAIVALFLNMYFEYMLKSPKWPFVGSDPQLRRINSYLLIDEASNIMKYGFPVLEEILIQGREFGIGVILSAQYLSQFRAAGYNYAEPLRTWFIHNVPQLNPNELRQLGIVNANDQLAARIQSQAQHECYYRSLGLEGSFMTGLPFYRLLSARP